MSLTITGVAYPVIFLSELPGKPMVASLALATRVRPAAVWGGAARRTLALGRPGEPGGEHVSESVGFLGRAGAAGGLPVLAARPFQARTFSVPARSGLAGGRHGTGPDPAVGLLYDEEPLGSGLMPGERGEEDPAGHGGGDPDAGRPVIRLGPQPVAAAGVNDPAAAGGPGTESGQQGHALGGGREPHDGLRVTASARGGELDGAQLPPATLAGGLDLEGPYAGAGIAGNSGGCPAGKTKRRRRRLLLVWVSSHCCHAARDQLSPGGAVRVVRIDRVALQHGDQVGGLGGGCRSYGGGRGTGRPAAWGAA